MSNDSHDEAMAPQPNQGVQELVTGNSNICMDE